MVTNERTGPGAPGDPAEHQEHHRPAVHRNPRTEPGHDTRRFAGGYAHRGFRTACAGCTVAAKKPMSESAKRPHSCASGLPVQHSRSTMVSPENSARIGRLFRVPRPAAGEAGQGQGGAEEAVPGAAGVPAEATRARQSFTSCSRKMALAPGQGTSPGEVPDIAGIVPGPQPSPWGDDERDIVPLNQLAAARYVGGSLVGAFADRTLINFIYGF